MRISVTFVTLLVITSLISQSVVIDKFAIALIAINFILESRKQAFLLNPFSLFFFTPASLVLYWPIADKYMMDLTHSTLFLCILHFCLLFLLFKYRLKSINVANYMPIKFIHKRTLLLLNILLYIFGLIGLFLPLLSSFSWILIFFALSVILREDKRIFYILLVSYIVIVILDFYISKLFLLNISLFLAIHFQRRRLIWRMRYLFFTKVFLIGVVLMLFFFKIGNKERGYSDTSSIFSYYSEQGIDWAMSPSLLLPYMYVTTPWTNLQYVINDQDDLTYGSWLIKPITGYLGLNTKRPLELQSYSSFNTFTFIAVFFKDFGYLGSLLGTFIIGHFIVYVYGMYLKRPYGLVVGLYSIVSLAVVQMYFSNHFIMQSYPITAFLIYTIIVTLRRVLWSYGQRNNNLLWPSTAFREGNT